MKSKLTAEDVAEIKRLKGTMSYRKVGVKYGISSGYVRDIVLGYRLRGEG